MGFYGIYSLVISDIEHHHFLPGKSSRNGHYPGRAVELSEGNCWVIGNNPQSVTLVCQISMEHGNHVG